MSYKLTLIIPGLPATQNAMGRRHWTIKAAESKKWRTYVKMLSLGKEPPAPLTKAKIILTRHSSAECDFDGLVSSFKAPLDGLVDAGIIVNDKPSVIGQPSYHWQKVIPRTGYITIEVEEV